MRSFLIPIPAVIASIALVACADDGAASSSAALTQGASSPDWNVAMGYSCVLRKTLADENGALRGQAEVATYHGESPTRGAFFIREDNVADLPIRFFSTSDPIELGKSAVAVRIARHDLGAEAQTQGGLRRGEDIETTLFTRLPTADPGVVVVSIAASCRLD